MIVSIEAYEVYWSTESNRGGIRLGLPEKGVVDLEIGSHEILRAWCRMLQLGPSYYYQHNGTTGICSGWSGSRGNGETAPTEADLSRWND